MDGMIDDDDDDGDDVDCLDLLVRVTGSVKAQTRVDDLWPNCVAHKCTQIYTIA